MVFSICAYGLMQLVNVLISDAASGWPRNGNFTPSVPHHQNGHLQHHQPMPHTPHYCEWLCYPPSLGINLRVLPTSEPYRLYIPQSNKLTLN